MSLTADGFPSQLSILDKHINIAGAGGFYAPGGTGDSGQEKGFTNPVFAEEPPPDYTSAVAQVIKCM